MKLFSEKEIEHEYKFQKDSLPLLVDCLKYVSSRKDVKDHDVVVNELAKLLYDIWMKADCCPMNIRNIRRTFEDHVWKDYVKFIKQGAPGRKHGAKPKVVKEATRKS